MEENRQQKNNNGKGSNGDNDYFALLPRETTYTVLSFLDAAGLGRCACTNRALNRIVDDNDDNTAPVFLWRDLAAHKYGRNVVDVTSELYDNNFKGMLKDDNVRGALPTLTLQNGVSVPWYWLRSIFCVTVSELRWDRVNGIVQVHIDNRGEGAQRYISYLACARGAYAARTLLYSRPVANHTIESARGHWKGYLEYPAHFFNTDEMYSLHAPQFRNKDYVTLFSGRLDAQQFDKYTVRGTSPYDDDTPDIERTRFEPHVP